MDEKELLRQLWRKRKDRGIKQYEVAEKLGITQEAYTRIENGKVGLTISRLFQIAEILDCSIEDLFESGMISDLNKKWRSELDKLDMYFKNIEVYIDLLGTKLQECLQTENPPNTELYKKIEESLKLHQDLLNAVQLYKFGREEDQVRK